MTNTETMPGPDGQEMTLEQHVAQSTMCHETWNELDHAEYLISEVGFDGSFIGQNMERIIQQMLLTRSQINQQRGTRQWPVS